MFKRHTLINLHRHASSFGFTEGHARAQYSQLLDSHLVAWQAITDRPDLTDAEPHPALSADDLSELQRQSRAGTIPAAGTTRQVVESHLTALDLLDRTVEPSDG